MITARLIDLEGVTVGELTLDVPAHRPGMYISAASFPRINWAKVRANPFAPLELLVSPIEYRFERITGDAVYIYRRITPPWG